MTRKSVFPSPKTRPIQVPSKIYAHLAYLAYINNRSMEQQFTHVFEQWQEQNGISKFADLEEYSPKT